MIVQDQLQRDLELKAIPKRIISLVPSQTELLVDLGLEHLLVGVTKFCVHPNQIRKTKVVVGGTKTIKIDKIKTLHPDIILCNKEENTEEIIEALTPVAPIHISDVNSMDDCFQLIQMYGEIFNVESKSNQLIDTIIVARKCFKNKHYPPKKVAYFIWKNPWMVAASQTFINDMLQEAGFANVFQNHKRYPEITIDDKSLEEAEVIMLSSEPYPFSSKHISELQEKFPYKRILLVDGELFSWYGSRLQYAYNYFKTLHQ